MKNIKVENIKEKPYQFIITTDEGQYLQSYTSIIAFIPNPNYKPELHGFSRGDYRTQLDADTWDYSRTTGKYRNIFLSEEKIETDKKIKDKQYILTNLNK